jgi:hypothetical protein
MSRILKSFLLCLSTITVSFYLGVILVNFGLYFINHAFFPLSTLVGLLVIIVGIGISGYGMLLTVKLWRYLTRGEKKDEKAS